MPRGTREFPFQKKIVRARAYIRESMVTEAGLDVYVDAAGNMIGRCDGEADLPCIMVGSHLDTVPGGGRFDGIAGVVAGLEIARRFNEAHIQLQHPMEVVVFLAEEPSPFGLSTIGSRAMAGKLASQDLFAITDGKGSTLVEGIRSMGGDPHNIQGARRNAGRYAGFFRASYRTRACFYFHAGLTLVSLQALPGFKEGE